MERITKAGVAEQRSLLALTLVRFAMLLLRVGVVLAIAGPVVVLLALALR
ncbi:hypothetical protein [Falsiroseomonas sp. CW058]